MDSTKLKNRMSTKMQELETPAPLPFEMGLAPVNADFAALSNNALSVIRENLKNQPLALDFFDVVKSPSGGSTVFSVPGLNGDEPETELTGIILDYTTPRAYWHTPEPVEGTPPDCMSVNSIISAVESPVLTAPTMTLAARTARATRRRARKVCCCFCYVRTPSSRCWCACR